MSNEEEGINWEDKLFDLGLEDKIDRAKKGSAKAATEMLAKLMKGYYDSLIEAGFDEEKALTFTIDYQRSILINAEGNIEEDDK